MMFWIVKMSCTVMGRWAGDGATDNCAAVVGASARIAATAGAIEGMADSRITPLWGVAEMPGRWSESGL
jgi:hypothetical protein